MFSLATISMPFTSSPYREMFHLAESFNGDLSKWSTSNVKNMARTFSGAKSFNSDISNWDVSSVLDMYRMFYNATSFNQNLCNWADYFPYSKHGGIGGGMGDPKAEGAKVVGMFMLSGCNYRDTPKREGRGPFCAVESCPVEGVEGDDGEVETEGVSSEGSSSTLEGIPRESSSDEPKSYRWIMATFLLTSLGVAVIAALRKVATNVYYKERVVRHYSSVEMHAREDNISETDSAWSQTFGSRQVS
jgi:surface protein